MRFWIGLVAVACWGQDLPPRLAEWKQEIEKTGGGKLHVVRVTVETRDGQPTYVLPDSTPDRPVMARYFGDANFRAQFVRTHAVTLNYTGPEGRIAFIVLNMARLKGSEEIVLSHEFGHAWLHAKGLRAPALPPGGAACQAIHVGDMVQHILIREEQTRRGFDFRPDWVAELELAADNLKKQAPETQPPADPCLRLERLAHLVDVEAGLTDEQWTGRAEFLGRLPAGDPRMAEMGHRLVRILRVFKLEEPTEYYLALSTVLSATHLLFQPPNGTP